MPGIVLHKSPFYWFIPPPAVLSSQHNSLISVLELSHEVIEKEKQNMLKPEMTRIEEERYITGIGQGYKIHESIPKYREEITISDLRVFLESRGITSLEDQDFILACILQDRIDMINGFLLSVMGILNSLSTDKLLLYIKKSNKESLARFENYDSETKIVSFSLNYTIFQTIIVDDNGNCQKQKEVGKSKAILNINLKKRLAILKNEEIWITKDIPQKNIVLLQNLMAFQGFTPYKTDSSGNYHYWLDIVANLYLDNEQFKPWEEGESVAEYYLYQKLEAMYDKKSLKKWTNRQKRAFEYAFWGKINILIDEGCDVIRDRISNEDEVKRQGNPCVYLNWSKDWRLNFYIENPLEVLKRGVKRSTGKMICSGTIGVNTEGNEVSFSDLRLRHDYPSTTFSFWRSIDNKNMVQQRIEGLSNSDLVNISPEELSTSLKISSYMQERMDLDSNRLLRRRQERKTIGEMQGIHRKALSLLQGDRNLGPVVSECQAKRELGDGSLGNLGDNKGRGIPQEDMQDIVCFEYKGIGRMRKNSVTHYVQPCQDRKEEDYACDVSDGGALFLSAIIMLRHNASAVDLSFLPSDKKPGELSSLETAYLLTRLFNCNAFFENRVLKENKIFLRGINRQAAEKCLKEWKEKKWVNKDATLSNIFTERGAQNHFKEAFHM